MPSDGNNLAVAPGSNELEVSVFGPGFGECILLHLGHGQWAVVDSCLDAASKQPAALHYLAGFGANPAGSIQLVLATHWHDDHMHGISRVFQVATDAIFACTAAVQQADFKEVLTAWTGTRFLAGGSGIDELRSIFVELKKRSSNSSYVSPKLAIAGKTLWPVAGKPNPMGIRITSLSPSDAAVLATISRLKGVVPPQSKARRRLPLLKENDTSVVLSFEAGGHRVLLGGDLHVKLDRSLGWLAIVDDYAAPEEKHHAFKVPHHGSPTGHHDEVWSTMIVEQACAVTTPFVGGRVRLPSLADCQRILSRTQNAYLSAPPLPGKFRDANKAVEKTVQEATRLVQMVPGKYGHVRLRKNLDESPVAPWQVELFGSAVSVADYIAVPT